jgi:DNA-binding NarL/FixJ family response regulator
MNKHLSPGNIHGSPGTFGFIGEQNDPASPAARQADGEMNVVVIDSRLLDRECFCSFLKIHEQKFNVSAFGSREEWLASSHAPAASVVILSIGGTKLSEPAVINGLRQTASELSPVPVVVLGDSEDLTHILRALECGARGYIPSSVGLTVCVEAIKLAIAGGTFIPANPVMAMSKVIEGSDTCQHFAGMFTPRQADVVMALRRGKANKIIAYELNMRESTVKVHIRNIMKKLRATNRTEVACKINDLLMPEVAAHN